MSHIHIYVSYMYMSYIYMRHEICHDIPHIICTNITWYMTCDTHTHVTCDTYLLLHAESIPYILNVLGAHKFLLIVCVCFFSRVFRLMNAILFICLSIGKIGSYTPCSVINIKCIRLSWRHTHHLQRSSYK